MKTARYTQIFLIAFALVISGGLIFTAATFAQAQEHNPFNDIEYPIAELGGCENEGACHAYCDDIAHINECVDFAEAHGLMSAEEVQHARSFARAGGEGPGGCTGRDSCEVYCEDLSNVRECLAFADEHDLMDEDDIREAQFVVQALDQGVELPGGCTNKRECEAYCTELGNMNECVAFAEAAGFAEPEELEEMKKVAAYVESGGQMPGGCQNERECEAYCMEDAHINECTEFAIGAGFMSPEEAEMFRKTGGRGPGGCRGRECETYCDDSAHQKECIAFAMEHDLISEGDKRRMEEGMSEARRALEEAPPEVLTCIEESLEASVSEILTQEFMMIQGHEMGRVMQRCFRENMQFERGGFGSESEGEFDSDRERGFEGGGPDVFGDMPPEARSCLHEIYGEDFEARMRTGELDPRTFDRDIRRCMEQFFAHDQFDRERFDESDEGGDFRPDLFDHEDEFRPRDFEEFEHREEDFKPQDFDRPDEHRGEFLPPEDSRFGEFEPQDFNRHEGDFRVQDFEQFNDQFENDFPPDDPHPSEDFRPTNLEEFVPENLRDQFKQEFNDQREQFENQFQNDFDAGRERIEVQHHEPPESDFAPLPDKGHFDEPPGEDSTREQRPPEETTREEPTSHDGTQSDTTGDDSAQVANPFLANVLTIFAQLLGR